MKNAYPIVLIPEKNGYTVYIPDFDINTQGNDLSEAIEMARDAVGIMGIDLEEDGKAIPAPSNVADITLRANEHLSFVNVDFTEYRRK